MFSGHLCAQDCFMQSSLRPTPRIMWPPSWRNWLQIFWICTAMDLRSFTWKPALLSFLLVLRLFEPGVKNTYSIYVTWIIPNGAPLQVEYQEQKHFYRFVFIGTKGDWPFLRASLGLSTGYNCDRKCHRCHIEDTQLLYGNFWHVKQLTMS